VSNNFGEDAMESCSFESFINNIVRIVNLPITLYGSYRRPLEISDINTEERASAYDMLPRTERLLHDLYFKAHRWFPANPSKQDTVDLCNELYVIDPLFSDDPSIYANYLIRHDDDHSKKIFNIEEYIVKKMNDDNNDTSRLIMLGKRGSGKTAFINFWLNNRSSYLEEKKILWLRIDVSKIYDEFFAGKNIVEKKGDSAYYLDNYHMIHTLYVILKYGKDEQAGYDAKNKRKSLLHETMNFLSQDLINDSSMLDFIDKCKEKIAKDFNAEKNTEKFISYILNDNVKLSNIRTLYDKVIEYWKVNDYRVMLIIDGIDNISKEERESDYEVLMKQLVYLYVDRNGSEVSPGFKLILLVIRPETYNDLKKYSMLTNHNNLARLEGVHRMNLAITNIDKIIERKNEIIQFPKSKNFKNSQLNALYVYNGRDSEFNKDIQGFIKYSNLYRCSLEQHITERFKSAGQNIDDFKNNSSISKAIFDENFRVYANNLIYSHALMRVMDDKGVRNATRPNRYFQYLFLAGNLYPDSPVTDLNANDIKNHKIVFPNLFYWDSKFDYTVKDGKHNEHWRGLISIRALQLLQYRQNTDKHIFKDMMCKIFEVEDKFFDYIVRRLIRFGLIEYCVEIKSANEPMRITKKGRLYYKFIFMYSYLLYFCALDVQLSTEFTPPGALHHSSENDGSLDSKFIELYRDNNINFNFQETFSACYVKTVLTFTRHIITQHNIDMEIINRKWDDYSADMGIYKGCKAEDIKKIYDIPSYFIPMLKNDIVLAINGLQKNYSDSAKELYDDLKGAYIQFFNVHE
jgi:hypothetical protein